MNVIFLDIDSVMIEWDGVDPVDTTMIGGMHKFNDRNVSALNDILSSIDCEIVITSDRRKRVTLDDMINIFRLNGVIKSPIGYTPIIESKGTSLEIERYREINTWINSNKVDDFAIIDDLNMSGLRNMIVCISGLHEVPNKVINCFFSSTTAKKAANELSLLNSDHILLKYRKELLGICEKFGLSGLSGGSGPYFKDMIVESLDKLLTQNALFEISDDNWIDICDEFYQNSRCSALFKEKDTGMTYYLDAIRFVVEDDPYRVPSKAYTINDEKFTAKQYVKFPFTPKTFEVNVSVDINDELMINNMSQLDDVFEYYLPAGSYKTMKERNEKINLLYDGENGSNIC